MLALSCLHFRPWAFSLAFKVSLGNIFRGQTGHVWTKDVALMVEVANSARNEEGEPLPVVVSAQAQPRRIWYT